MCTSVLKTKHENNISVSVGFVQLAVWIIYLSYTNCLPLKAEKMCICAASSIYFVVHCASE